MFDTYQITQGTTSTDVNVRVTEQRAPTDQSVQLLKEFEQKAREKFIGQIHLQGNGFNASMYVENDDFCACRNVMVLFDLNGKRVEVRKQLIYEAKEEAIQAIIEAVAKKVASEVLRHAFSALPPEQGRMLIRRKG